MRYSDDRLSLAQEIADTLRVRGYWVPDNWASSDLIMAVGKALDSSFKPSRAVVQCDREGNELKTFESINKASEETEIPTRNIVRVCKNRKKWQTAGGFVWKYKETV